MRGKDVIGTRRVERFLESQLLFAHQYPDSLQRQERRMPLVHVIRRGLETQLLQSAQTTDSQDDFLPDPRVTIAAVKLVGDLAVVGAGVLRNIAVEKKQFHAAGVDAPNFQK